MTEFTQMAMPYLSKEVFTILGALVAVWIGWKAFSKTVGFAGKLGSVVLGKTVFLALIAIVLFTGGITSAGFGLGELVFRDTSATERPMMSGDQLVKLAEKCGERDVAQSILSYAQKQDNQRAGNKNLNVAELARLVQNVTPQNKDATIAFIEYLKTRQSILPSQEDAINTAIMLVADDTIEPPLAKIPNETRLTGSAALGLFGAGLSFALIGTVFFARYRNKVNW